MPNQTHVPFNKSCGSLARLVRRCPPGYTDEWINSGGIGDGHPYLVPQGAQGLDLREYCGLLMRLKTREVSRDNHVMPVPCFCCQHLGWIAPGHSKTRTAWQSMHALDRST